MARYLIITFGIALIVPSLVARLIFLAPTKLGAPFYYSNILGDFFWKRWRIRRSKLELASLSIGAGCIGIAASECGIYIVLFLLTSLLLLELYKCKAERNILTSVNSLRDSRSVKRPVNGLVSKLAGAIPDPSVHPILNINLVGPFVSRLPVYHLGDLAIDRKLRIEIIVANHTILPCQVPIWLTVKPGPGLKIDAPIDEPIPPIASGDFCSRIFLISAVSKTVGGKITIVVAMADQVYREDIVYDSVFDPTQEGIINGSITRYPGASRAAFAWRGDMDCYDAITFQSIAGLSRTLSLAARYCFPQTMYISTRLSVCQSEARQFSDHFGVERGHSEISKFIDWMKQNVDFRHRISYPFKFAKPFALELGNHMHLHYGTHAAACPENQWLLGAGIGAGLYPWMSSASGSYSEQMENALKAKRVIEETFGFTPKSWAMPDSTNDQFTPSAVEAAGCEVLSDSNASSRHNVLFQPSPHHPDGATAVELTKRYPGDPRDITHYAMILYWLHRAYRKGIPMIYMCHQHLRLFDDLACERFTETMMRYVLTKFKGDLYIDTVYGVGIYWREVFSPKMRRVQLENRSKTLIVHNNSDTDFVNVPVDIQYSGGANVTVLVNLTAHSSVEIDLYGNSGCD